MLTGHRYLCLLAGLFLLNTAQAETASLQHDANGNITQRTTALGTTTFTYDALNRLQSEDFLNRGRVR